MSGQESLSAKVIEIHLSPEKVNQAPHNTKIIMPFFSVNVSPGVRRFAGEKSRE
jgi:hypothetical protein